MQVVIKDGSTLWYGRIFSQWYGTQVWYALKNMDLYVTLVLLCSNTRLEINQILVLIN